MVLPKKNAAAVALAKLRIKKLSPERRSQIAGIAGKVGGVRRSEVLTKDQRRAIGVKGGKARWDAYYKANPDKLREKKLREGKKKRGEKAAVKAEVK